MLNTACALNAPPTECLCCNHVCRQRSNSGEQACSGMPYPRISPHFPPVFPRFSPFFPHFPPFSPIFPHFPHFPHFSVAQKRLGDSGVGDFQGLHDVYASVRRRRSALITG